MTSCVTVRCLVVGGGPTGLAAAAALASLGVDVAIAGVDEAGGLDALNTDVLDTRTAALFPASLRLLDSIAAGPQAGLTCTALTGIRIIDMMGGLLRAPEVLFLPGEIGLPTFGSNVSQHELSRALRQALGRSEVRVLTGGPVTSLAIRDDRATATLADGTTIDAQLVVAADGRNSLTRAAAGIEVRRWRYDQVALATHFRHQRSHEGISTELHRPAGPCTTVPMAGNASSLVWVERPAIAAELATCDPNRTLAALDDLLAGLLGPLSDLGPRRAFPLEGLAAASLARNRVALVGEAAHVIPPIGAQGLNLGLFDVASLADCIDDATAAGRDIGAEPTLRAYAHARAADVDRRMAAVDFVNRSLSSGLAPLVLARGLGLHVIAAMPAVRRRVIRQGLEPPGPLPRLMSAVPATVA